MTKLNYEFLKSLPKAELHCHLDGSVRPKTMWEMAQKHKVKLPVDSEEKLANFLAAGDKCESLEEYLRPFDITTSVLQWEDSLYRATYELAEDAAEENVRYLEIRFSPVLHIKKGLKLTEVLDAVIKGKKQAEKDLNITIGIIICGLRHFDPEVTLKLAELTVAYKNRGVVGFDLAGAERDFPAKDHKEAFYLIINNNINTTVHAGEAYGPESIHQAIHYNRANRLGHGTRLFEDGDLLNYVNDHRIPLEVCLTSNVQTKSVASFEKHPIKFYFDMGIRVTLNTDNRLISNTTLTREYELAVNEFGFTKEELKYLIINSFKSAFLPLKEKVELLRNATKELEKKGLQIRKDYV
ncbi:MAG TPA: adenosine deaminase [Salinivirga sp.]|uniref:adenosine deaminase n=1 Tax=Salinivirga sp. TaxID=1970192 RepID=UPI002B4A96C0|nr:adenosine deaminase [Salinivirga sp.]HKK59102.1 adenosine deaminase [Salinivirga sp.]